jgi:hypothetical protein
MYTCTPVIGEYERVQAWEGVAQKAFSAAAGVSAFALLH